MRVLFSAHGAYGHVLPLVPAAHALQRAGHDVRFAVADELHPALSSLGLEAHAAGLRDSALVAEARRRWPQAVREPPVSWAVRMFTDIAAPAMARDLARVIDAWRPELVVREEGEYGAPMAAAAARVAWITHGWGSPPPPAADRARVSQLLEPHWNAVGLPPPDGEDLNGAGLLDPCPPSLSAGPRTSAPTCAIRPSIVELPPDGEPLTPGGGDLVYVGFGTAPLYRDDPLLLTLVRGLLAAGLRAVATAADANVEGQLRAMGGGRVVVRRWVSLSQLLPACRLAVCHGGAGTVLAALTAGIPLLLLPRGAPSQARMSAACAGRGAARTLAPDEATTAGVEAALRDLMDDDRFRRNARGIADEIAGMPEPGSVVPWLEQAARQRT
ncbi:MAG TPA: glycosyltransferase [Gaiellales bacterium]|nr:glycosyltransferase [Gaiellales bacterium]